MISLFRNSIISITQLGLIIALSAQAQISTDGTLGPAQNLTGPNYQIGADLGQQHGGNLFHSFQDFNLRFGESATFSGPNSIQNVISRVTGGNASNIDGLIRSTIPNADFYFLNPYGIVFGPNASLDVQGSFHASTADYLRLGDNEYFYSDLGNESVLSVAPPTAFGFLEQSQSIEIKGSFLQTSVSNTLSIVGGDITIQDGVLFAPNGRLGLAAIASRGEVDLTSNNYLHINANQTGKIKISHTGEHQQQVYVNGEPYFYDFDLPVLYGNIDVTNYNNLFGDINIGIGTGKGQIFIHSNQLFLDNAWVFTDIFDAQTEQRMGIDIMVDGDMALTNSSRITAENKSLNEENRGSDIVIKAQNLTLSTEIDWSNYEEKGDAINEFSLIAINNYSDGQGGEIRLEIQNTFTLIAAALLSTTEDGDAGNIEINAREVSIQNSGVISTDTFGIGKAGNIMINARDEITLSQGSLFGNLASASFFEYEYEGDEEFINDDFEGTLIAGNAGNIIVDTPVLILKDDGYITTYAAQGRSGNILLNVHDFFQITNDSWISTEVFGGKEINSGGNIFISNPEFFLLDKGQILAATVQGNGGNIDIDADYFISSYPFALRGNIPSNILAPKIKNRNSYNNISASSQVRQIGKIWINPLEEHFSKKDLLALSRNFDFLETAKLLINQCPGLTRDDLSSFSISIGTQTRPSAPDDFKTHAIQITDILPLTVYQIGASQPSANFDNHRQSLPLRIGCARH